MKQNQFPEEWDEAHVQRVLAYYENQSEAEQIAEDEWLWAQMSLELAMRGMEDEDTPEYTIDDLKEKF